MAFEKGRSGNPAGRTPGIASAERLRRAIADELPEVVAAMVAAAKKGDVTAGKVLMDRCLAPLKARDLPVSIGPLPGKLGEAAMTILQAVAEGRVTPLQGQQMLAGLGNVSRAIETDELMRRIERLEKGDNEQSADPN